MSVGDSPSRPKGGVKMTCYTQPTKQYLEKLFLPGFGDVGAIGIDVFETGVERVERDG